MCVRWIKLQRAEKATRKGGVRSSRHDMYRLKESARYPDGACQTIASLTESAEVTGRVVKRGKERWCRGGRAAEAANGQFWQSHFRARRARSSVKLTTTKQDETTCADRSVPLRSSMCRGTETQRSAPVPASRASSEEQIAIILQCQQPDSNVQCAGNKPKRKSACNDDRGESATSAPPHGRLADHSQTTS